MKTEKTSAKSPLVSFALHLLPFYFPSISKLICRCDDKELLDHLCEKYGDLNPEDYNKSTFPAWKTEYLNLTFGIITKVNDQEDDESKKKMTYEKHVGFSMMLHQCLLFIRRNW